LKSGDFVNITTPAGKFQYTVTRVFIIAPTRVDVLNNVAKKSTLTLITYHPKFSTSKRLIVSATLTNSVLRKTKLAAPTAVPTTTPTNSPTTAGSSTSTTTSTPAEVAVAASDVGESSSPIDDLGRWFSDTSAIMPTILLGLLLAVIAAAAHFAQLMLRRCTLRKWRARTATYVVVSLPFFITLFYWYRFLNLLLPAGA